MSQSTIDAIQVIVSAGSGAIAGSLVSILTGPTIAEREERGRSRVTARRAVGRALQDYRYDLANTRLVLLENQSPETEALIKAAFNLACEVYEALPVISWIERRRLERRINALIGREMLETARLRPRKREDDELSDAASTSVALRYRTAPGQYMKELLGTDPLAHEWESVIRRAEKLSRKYR
jgi:hypothetical protein